MLRSNSVVLAAAIAVLGYGLAVHPSFAGEFQDGVYSVNTVGFVQIDKPGNNKLNMVGVSLVSSNQTLNSLAHPKQFSGDAYSTAKADRLHVWNAATQQYDDYALFDARDVNGMDYSDDFPTGWQRVTNFGAEGTYENPQVPVGSAFWLRGSTSSDQTIVLAGDIVTSPSVTNSMVEGLQMISNPFADSVKLNDGLALHENATGDAFSTAKADRLHVWNAATQKYDDYALFDARDVNGEDLSDEYPTGWQPVTHFGAKGTYTDAEIRMGQGFWLRVANVGFDWIETNRYLDAISP